MGRDFSSKESLFSDIRKALGSLNSGNLPKLENLKVTDSLPNAGLIDSLGMLELVSALEENFQIVIQSNDLTMEHFESISSIADFIIKKSAEDSLKKVS